jgi:DNA-binding CsgD family transcriptional regulator
VPRTSGVPDADHVAPEQRGRAGAIASELSVSVNTVNTHVRNIYAKPQARDRSAAVQRARELRLLSAGLTR